MGRLLELFTPFQRAKGASPYPAKFTLYSLVCTAAALMGGFLFGYDLGVAGGVSTMPAFSSKFFPSVYEATVGEHKYKSSSPWCGYNNQVLSLFNSVIYIAAMFSAIMGSQLAHHWGRKLSMIFAGLSYLIGAALNAGAANIEMLIMGRVLLGAGIGFANSSVTIYANECSPAHLRGGLNLIFQLSTCVGLLIAQILNYYMEDKFYGWRISLGMAGVPAIIILVAGLVLPESPTSLIERNKLPEGRRVLQRVRGKNVDVEAEFQAIYNETREAASTRWPIMKILRLEACYVPHLVTSLVITAGQQLTGMNGILFYSPQIFSTIGSANSSALLNAVVIGSVLVGGTFVAILFVDNFGRRFFYVYSGIALGAFEVTCGVLINKYFKEDNNVLTAAHSTTVLIVICLFVVHYAFSYGPLGWLVTSEIQPAEIRTAGMSVATANNMLFTFLIGQAFLSMMCTMQAGVFYLFSGFCFAQALYFLFFLPETKGLHVEEVHRAFHRHWFWRRFPEVPRRDGQCDVVTFAENGQVDLEIQRSANAAAAAPSAATAPPKRNSSLTISDIQPVESRESQDSLNSSV